MDRPEPGPTVATLLHSFEPTEPFVTGRSRQALEHLTSVFEDSRPLAILNSGWAAGSVQVLNSFLSQLPKNVSVAQVAGSGASESAGMRNLIRSIGFDPKDLVVTDLRLIFENFLSFQRKRNRRTVVVMEDAGLNGEWVCNYVGRLVELEAREKFGMTVILVRQTRFDEFANEPSLDPISYKVGKHISLTPFTPLETREFIRWRIQATESANLGRILGLDAISLIHELCDGMPDAIDHLFCESLVLADDEDIIPVTTDIVMRASEALRLEPMAHQPKPSTRIAASPAKGIPTLPLPKAPRIVLIHKGRTLRELPVTQQRISIGRSDENDLCIDSPYISRQHATIFRNGAETAVVDLDSRNGTFVNSQRIQVQTISDRDEIRIGYHTIRFFDPDAPRIHPLNGIGRSRKPVVSQSAGTQREKTGGKEGVVRR